MAGSPFDGIDDDVFYNAAEFGVVADVSGTPEPGLFDIEEIEAGGVLALRPVFRSRNRIPEGSTLIISATTYTVQAAQPLETGEYGHILSNDA